MINKKYRVKNTKTGNFVSEELSSTAATKLCGELTIISDDRKIIDAYCDHCNKIYYRRS